MKWPSIIAIFVLFWTMSAFGLLPCGVKTHEELGIERVPGQADSAPGNFRPGRLALRATAIAVALTVLFVANYINGWVTASSLIPE